MNAEAKRVGTVAGGSAPVATGARRAFAGPTFLDYLESHDLTEADFTPLSCGGGPTTVNINAQARLLGNLAQAAQITTDSIDGRLAFVDCP